MHGDEFFGADFIKLATHRTRAREKDGIDVASRQGFADPAIFINLGEHAGRQFGGDHEAVEQLAEHRDFFRKLVNDFGIFESHFGRKAHGGVNRDSSACD